eukprot:TRINITY_DN18541_c0_g2_i1.p1 TRINITY_DN18541_c0_g2~~TRINITY_DN18541_c0_g2_i1.p1  ORF type:complete len:1182 (+),score=106.20 TRINITY_DN18541_c0_g2_i1:81-3626(+)
MTGLTRANFVNVAGVFGTPYSADGPDTCICSPVATACHTDGRVFISESSGSNSVVVLDPSGSISVLIGRRGEEGLSSRCGDGTHLGSPYGIALSPNEDSLLVCDVENHRVLRVHLATRHVVVVAGTGERGGQDGHKDVATLHSPVSAVEDEDGVVYISTESFTVRRVDPTDGQVTTIAGQHASPGREDGSGKDARLEGPKQIVYCGRRKQLFLRCGQCIRIITTNKPNYEVSTLQIDMPDICGSGLALGCSGTLFFNTIGGLFQAFPPADGVEGECSVRNISTKDSIDVPGSGYFLSLSVDGKTLMNSYAGFHVIRGTTSFLHEPPARPPVPKHANLYRLVQQGFGEEVISAQVSNTRFLMRSAQLAYEEGGGRNLLHVASGAGQCRANTRVLRVLLDMGLQELVGNADDSGLTPLHYACGACSRPCYEAARLLLALPDVDCTAEDKKGNDPMYYAVGAVHTADADVVELLLHHKAEADRKDAEGYHRIHLAAGAKSSPSPKAMLALYSAGVNVEVADAKGKTILQYGSPEAVAAGKTGEEIEMSNYSPPHNKAISKMLNCALGYLEEKLFKNGDLDAADQVRLADLHQLCVKSLNVDIEVARENQTMLEELVRTYDRRFRDPYRLIHTSLAADPKYEELMVVIERRRKVCQESNGDFLWGDGACHQRSSYIEGVHADNPNFSGNGKYMRTHEIKNGKPVFTHQKKPFSVFWDNGHWIVGSLDGGSLHQGFWDRLILKSDADEPELEGGQWHFCSGELKPKPLPFKFRPFSLFDSFRCATVCKVKYDKLLARLAILTGEQDAYLKCRPKGFYRTWEKATVFRGKCKFFGETVCDIVRGALQYDRMSNMLLAFQLLCALDPHLVERDPSLKGFLPCVQHLDTDTDSADFSIDILDIKNRFAKPTNAGWCDIAVRAYFRSDPTQHVFEIQFVHLDMFRCRARLGAHHNYAHARAAFELLEIVHQGDFKFMQGDPTTPTSMRHALMFNPLLRNDTFELDGSSEPAAEPGAEPAHVPESSVLATLRAEMKEDHLKLKAELHAQILSEIPAQAARSSSGGEAARFVPRRPPAKNAPVTAASLDVLRTEMRAEMMEQLRIKDQQMESHIHALQSQAFSREQHMKQLHAQQMAELRKEMQAQVDMLRAELRAVGVDASMSPSPDSLPGSARAVPVLPPLDLQNRRHSK